MTEAIGTLKKHHPKKYSLEKYLAKYELQGLNSQGFHHRLSKVITLRRKNKAVGNQHGPQFSHVIICDYFLFTIVSDVNSIVPTCAGS